MKAMKPRVAFQVPNTLTGEGNLTVDITFESMDDFSPAAVARKVDALNKLLEARTQLANLITYMDGKTGAEELIAKVLKDPALLQVAGRRAQADEARRRRASRREKIRPWPNASSKPQQAHGARVEASEFASLLQQGIQAEVRRRATRRSSSAVQTLAEQALRETHADLRRRRRARSRR